jgi:DNA-binding Xre family transcriptional regulator
MKRLSIDEYAAKRGISQEELEGEAQRLNERLRVWQLKEARKSQGITQKQLASRMSVSQKRISDLENGAVERVRIDTLQRYVQGLNGSLSVSVTLPGNEVVNLV